MSEGEEPAVEAIENKSKVEGKQGKEKKSKMDVSNLNGHSEGMQ